MLALARCLAGCGRDGGGCALAQQDPGTVYAITLGTAGTYTIAQTNGAADLELWVYDSMANNLAVIDEEWGARWGSATRTAPSR